MNAHVPPIRRIRGLAFADPPSYPGRQADLPTRRQAVVGFTAPTLIYDKMRELQRSAAAFDADVKRTIADPAFRAAWDAWYSDWQRFFEKYQSDWSKLGALFYTDELNQRVEDYRLQFGNFVADYSRMVAPSAPTPGMAPPPPPSLSTAMTPAGPVQRHPAAPGTPWQLPWWFWFGAGAAAVGGAFWLLNKYVLPKVPKVASDRDPPDPYYYRPLAARDPDMPVPRDLPVSLEEAANHPRAMVYRPMHHPHLLPAPVPRPSMQLPSSAYAVFSQSGELDEGRDAYIQELESKIEKLEGDI